MPPIPLKVRFPFYANAETDINKMALPNFQPLANTRLAKTFQENSQKKKKRNGANKFKAGGGGGSVAEGCGGSVRIRRSRAQTLAPQKKKKKKKKKERRKENKMYERLSCWQSRHRAKISRVSRKTQKVTSKRRDGRLYYVQYLYGWASERNVYTKKIKKRKRT